MCHLDNSEILWSQRRSEGGVRIWVYPLVRGEGKRLFENGVAPGSFRGTTPSTWIATFATA
jgi:hypothetical protein